jgi:hypothetical protein
MENEKQKKPKQWLDQPKTLQSSPQASSPSRIHTYAQKVCFFLMSVCARMAYSFFFFFLLFYCGRDTCKHYVMAFGAYTKAKIHGFLKGVVLGVLLLLLLLFVFLDRGCSWVLDWCDWDGSWFSLLLFYTTTFAFYTLVIVVREWKVCYKLLVGFCCDLVMHACDHTLMAHWGW